VDVPLDLDHDPEDAIDGIQSDGIQSNGDGIQSGSAGSAHNARNPDGTGNVADAGGYDDGSGDEQQPLAVGDDGDGGSDRGDVEGEGEGEGEGALLSLLDAENAPDHLLLDVDDVDDHLLSDEEKDVRD